GRGDLPAARLPYDAAALRLCRAGRHQCHAHPPAHLRHLQGSAGRAGAGPDLRLHSPSARAGAANAGRGLLPDRAEAADTPAPHVTALLDREGLIEPNAAAEESSPVGDIPREPVAFPANRDVRLQALARGDEGFLLALGYSTQRGYGRTHPFAG